MDLYKKDVNGKSTEKTFEEVKQEAEVIAKGLPDNIYKNFFEQYNKIVMVNPTKEKFKTSVLDYHSMN